MTRSELKASIAARVYKRSTYAGRKRHVYDFDGDVDGITCSVNAAPTKAECVRLAIVHADFIRANPSVMANGYTLRAIREQEFCLEWPRGHGGAFIFGAANMQAAIAYVAEQYDYHPEIQAFVQAVRS